MGKPTTIQRYIQTELDKDTAYAVQARLAAYLRKRGLTPPVTIGVIESRGVFHLYAVFESAKGVVPTFNAHSGQCR